MQPGTDATKRQVAFTLRFDPMVYERLKAVSELGAGLNDA